MKISISRSDKHKEECDECTAVEQLTNKNDDVKAEACKQNKVQSQMCLQELCEECTVTVTTDNSTNIVKAVQLNQCTRFQCLGHHLASGKLYTLMISNDTLMIPFVYYILITEYTQYDYSHQIMEPYLKPSSGGKDTLTPFTQELRKVVVFC